MSVTDPVTRDVVRATLIELLLNTSHHDAATTTTLTAIVNTRERLEAFHGVRDNPAGRHALYQDRHAALSNALGDIGGALLTARRDPDLPRLRAGLNVLATVALAWLDTLPTPHHDNDGDQYADAFYPPTPTQFDSRED